ncbi:MAG: dTDP-glucose 4,6-dehydratase [Candidatus Bathyarchaeia archaeon]
MKVLVTGGAGFIGSNFVHYMIEKHRAYEIIVLDKLTYAGRKENLQDVLSKITFVEGDVCKKEDVEKVVRGCDFVLNFAAETHVDRSVVEAGSFVLTNVFGTYNLLEACRRFEVKKFVQISTDEVYGHIFQGSFKEENKLSPRNPYSASKASADLLCTSFFETYGLPVIITRSTNNYGYYQHPEKLVPKTIIYALLNKKIPIYGEGKNVRDWIFVKDNCEAIDLVLHKGESGEIYNIAGKQELENIQLVKTILKLMNKPESLIHFVKDRPGHDLRYSLDISKIEKLGWKPKTKFEEGIRKTIEWYKANEWWWRPIIGRQEIDFYKKFK